MIQLNYATLVKFPKIEKRYSALRCTSCATVYITQTKYLSNILQPINMDKLTDNFTRASFWTHFLLPIFKLQPFRLATWYTLVLRTWNLYTSFPLPLYCTLLSLLQRSEPLFKKSFNLPSHPYSFNLPSHPLRKLICSQNEILRILTWYLETQSKNACLKLILYDNCFILWEIITV